LADLGVERAWPREELKKAPSLVQGSPKRNTPMAHAEAGDPRDTLLIWNAIYSIVTASRPISLASSSRCSES
jgi:hypothetical protein